MPKTFGELILFFCFGMFAILGYINTVIAAFGLFGSLMLGMRDGFDAASIFGCLLFTFLLIGELIDILLAKPKIILNYALPNMIAVVTGLVWLLFAALLVYELFWNGLVQYYWVFLSVAIILTVVNTPSMIFHTVLCIPKFRRYVRNLTEDIEQRVRNEEINTQENTP